MSAPRASPPPHRPRLPGRVPVSPCSAWQIHQSPPSRLDRLHCWPTFPGSTFSLPMYVHLAAVRPCSSRKQWKQRCNSTLCAGNSLQVRILRREIDFLKDALCDLFNSSKCGLWKMSSLVLHYITHNVKTAWFLPYRKENCVLKLVFLLTWPFVSYAVTWKKNATSQTESNQRCF